MVLYIHIKIFFCLHHSLPLNELSLLGLALDVVD